MAEERDSLLGRARRVGQVGAGLSSAAVAFGVNRLVGGTAADQRSAQALRAALGGIKGPVMKVAQLLATIPDFLPADYAEELTKLQAHAPAMGWSFVKRRMRAELGEDWQSKFADFATEAAHAASLGQVHRARGADGRLLACKLQYPEMASAVEADLAQLRVVLALFKQVEKAVDPTDMADEIAARLREELDYVREAKAMRLYRAVFADATDVSTPEPVTELSTPRLLTMTWLSGRPMSAFEDAPEEVRNQIARNLFTAWWAPMYRFGVIHGDPHLGNYSIREEGGQVSGLNLLDFGCIRIFDPKFVGGVIALYHALDRDDYDAQVDAYRRWGFANLERPIVEALNHWARFIYGPILDDRVRTIADGVAPAQYGRKEAFEVRKMLQERGTVKIPKEFVFMDRAAIGVGAAFLRLKARMNFAEAYRASIADFDVGAVAARQAAALGAVGLAAG